MTRRTDTYETTIDLEEEYDIEVIVNFSYSPGRAAQLYGDYPSPAEPAEYEIHSIERADDGSILILTQDLMDKLYDELAEHEGDHEYNYEMDRADYLYDLRRDEQLEEGWKND